MSSRPAWSTRPSSRTARAVTQRKPVPKKIKKKKKVAKKVDSTCEIHVIHGHLTTEFLQKTHSLNLDKRNL